MEKINPSKVVKLDGKHCGKCSMVLATAAAKCDQCNELFHLKCTGMPAYMAIKYFTTRITYTCEECIKKKTDQYEEMLNWIRDLGVSCDSPNDDVNNQNTVTTEPPNKASDYQSITNKLVESIEELRAEMHILAQKVSADSEQKLYSHVLQSTNKHSQQTTYTKLKAKAEASQQAVFVKGKKGSEITDADNKEITTALKSVPAVVMKKITENTVKLVFPNNDAKTRAVEALEQTPKLNTYEFTCEKKLRPKMAMTYVPDSIKDTDIIQAIMDKNPNITALIDEDNEIRVLFTKPGAKGYKTVILGVSPLIKNAIAKNGGRIYIQMSRCNVYDHYWAVRCGKCSQYGHKTEKCAQSKPRCGYCAGEHRSKDCNTKNNLKCCHCTEANRSETNHSIFDRKCPALIAARDLVIRRTMSCEDYGDTSSKN